MSGLGAIFQRDNAPVSRAASDRMGNALRLHGPHRQNTRVGSSFAQCWSHLGGFTPEDAFEAQPVVASNVSLVFSGFLTERSELAETLAISPADLARMDDSKRG